MRLSVRKLCFLCTQIKEGECGNEGSLHATNIVGPLFDNTPSGWRSCCGGDGVCSSGKVFSPLLSRSSRDCPPVRLCRCRGRPAPSTCCGVPPVTEPSVIFCRAGTG